MNQSNAVWVKAPMDHGEPEYWELDEIINPVISRGLISRSEAEAIEAKADGTDYLTNQESFDLGNYYQFIEQLENHDSDMLRLENFDPTLNPRAWRMGKTHRDAKSHHKVIAPLCKRLHIERKTQTGHRAGRKPRSRNKDRRREREDQRLMLLAA